MKLLLIGGSKIKNAANALEQRFNTLETSIATNVEELTLFGNSGLRFDRILLFEQAITKDGEILDKKIIRERTQKFMGTMKELFDSFDVVGIADNNEVLQSLREEMFEIKHRAVVVKVKASALSANILAGIASRSVPDLREIYKEVDVDRSIYRSPSTVLWSSDIESDDDWDMASDGIRTERAGETKSVFNTETMQWEEVPVNGQKKTGTSGQNVQPTPNEAAKNNAKPTDKKKFGIFGNRKA